MNLRDFIKERIVFIIINSLILLFTVLLLMVLKVDSFAILFIVIINGAGILIYHIFDYLRKKQYYNEIKENMESLDKKYLISEVIEEGTFTESKLIYDVICKSNKAMNDEIGEFKRGINDYREYIELWVHEIKTPIATCKLLIENNESPLTESIGEEVCKLENYIDQALFYTRSNTIEKDYIIKEMILSKIPEERQTTFFSATMPRGILELTKRYQKDPEHIKVVRKELTVSNTKQYYIETRSSNKLEVLCRLVDVYDPKLSVVFCNTKRKADELVGDLQARGYFADALHGDLKQTQRDIVMDKFRNGTIDILVATDVAARGIDVDDVECVFNYDLPQDEEYYVHRIGRTGRAGREGMSFTFVFGKEMRKMKDIERYTKSKLIKHNIPTITDVEEKKVGTFFAQVKQTIEEGHLTKQLQWLEGFCNDEDYAMVDIAAALVKLSLGEEMKEEIIEEKPRRERGDRKGGTGAKDGMIRLFINIGRNQRVQAKDIVGAIAGEVGIPGKVVGTIDIYDKYTFVEIPKKDAKTVIEKMKDIKIKGNKINIEKANKKKK